jgi:uncharacterized protein YjbI with pentapeptide repeats
MSYPKSAEAVQAPIDLLQEYERKQIDLNAFLTKLQRMQREDRRSFKIQNLNFSEADFANKNLQRLVFQHCNFEKARFGDLSHVLLDTCTLENADFSNSDLDSVAFRGGLMKFTHWQSAELDHCLFQDCDLTMARFVRTSLIQVVFKNSNLKQAIFAESALERACFSHCQGILYLGSPHGYPFLAGRHPRRDNAVVIWAGCHEFTLSQARDYWKDDDDGRWMVPGLLQMVELAEQKGWFD